MRFEKILRTARKLAARPPRNDWAGLHPPAQLHRLIECERARTDRNGDPFTLITLTPRHPESDQATLLYLARVLKHRLRLIDEAGWLNDRQLAVILPSTPAAGAWKVADDVCLSVPPNQPLPVCKVYCYPADWLENREERSAPEVQPRAAERISSGANSGEPLEALFSRPLPAWKRAIDVLGAGAGLALLAPLFGAVAVAIKIASPGPVLFRQTRSGRGGRPFAMYKFRSMVVDAERKKADLLSFNEQDGPAFKIAADPRVTRLGRFLRSTSIDELPQLWNVLRGEMSLVGPRPLPCDESKACLGWQRRRLDVTPGLTCIWQVKGRSRVSFSEWCRMDLQYVARRGVRQDLTLLLLTLPAVLLRKGAR